MTTNNETQWKPCMKRTITVHVREQQPGEKHISTWAGRTPVKPDDLIMRGVDGEEYPIGRELFERTYDLLATAPQPPEQPVSINGLPESEASATAVGGARAESINKIMEQAQVFASSWSLVGGRFDFGNGMQDSEEAKAELWGMVVAALLKADAQRPVPKPLTDERIKSMDYRGSLDEHIRVVRMTEFAHGIGKEQV